MSYMVFGYGSYDVPDEDIKGIKTIEEARKIMHRQVTKWCKEQGVNIKDTDYKKGDEYFCKGADEVGVCIFTIIQVPKIRNKVDQYLWDAKMEMKQASYAATDYAWSLCDCCVDYHTDRAEELIDKAMAVTDEWEYEED